MDLSTTYLGFALPHPFVPTPGAHERANYMTILQSWRGVEG